MIIKAWPNANPVAFHLPPTQAL